MTRACWLVGIGLLLVLSGGSAAQTSDVETRLRRAQELSDAGDYARAAQLFEEVLTSFRNANPESRAWAHFGRSFATHQLSEGEEVATAKLRGVVDGYRKAVALDPRGYLAAGSFNAGLVLRRLGERQEALDAFLDAATATHPSRWMFLLNAGFEYEALRLPVEAERSYRAAIAEAPDEIEARRALLELYGKEGWDEPLVATSSQWAAELRTLPWINNELTRLLQRQEPPVQGSLAESALLLLASSFARMALDSERFASSVRIEYARIVAVHPQLSDPVAALELLYEPRERGSRYSEAPGTGWWHETSDRLHAWSTVLTSLGHDAWLREDYVAAASYYEAAIGYAVPYRVHPWIDLDALVMLAATHTARLQFGGDVTDILPRTAALVRGVDHWVDERSGWTERERLALRDFYFACGITYTEAHIYPRAVELYRKSLAFDPDYAASYVNLGFIAMGSLDLASAVADFERAVELDPTEPHALNNLGFATLIYGDFQRAIEYLGRSYARNEALLTTLNLGDAYRFAGDFARALELHRGAREGIRTRSDDMNYMSTGWRYNYMPLRRGDTETIQQSVLVLYENEKRALVTFALSLDYALLGDLERAGQEFATAIELTDRSDVWCFFANKIASTQSFLQVADGPDRWLDQKRLALRRRGDCHGS